MIIDVPPELMRFLPILDEVREEMRKRGSDVWEFGPVMSRRRQPEGGIRLCDECPACEGTGVKGGRRNESPMTQDQFNEAMSKYVRLRPEDPDFETLCREFPAPELIE